MSNFFCDYVPFWKASASYQSVPVQCATLGNRNIVVNLECTMKVFNRANFSTELLKVGYLSTICAHQITIQDGLS